EQIDVSRAIESVTLTRMFFTNAKAMFADEQDLEGSIRSLLRVRDAPNTSDVEDRWIASHVGDRIGSNRDHSDLSAASECIASHLSISRLEDVERYGELRQQYDVREWEQGERFNALHADQLSRARAACRWRLASG
ncbi:unnamed protein product, partial [marine sediment metagenome]